jgi:hypothetical protein
VCRSLPRPQNDMDLGEIQGMQPALYHRYNVVDEGDDEDEFAAGGPDEVRTAILGSKGLLRHDARISVVCRLGRPQQSGVLGCCDCLDVLLSVQYPCSRHPAQGEEEGGYKGSSMFEGTSQGADGATEAASEAANAELSEALHGMQLRDRDGGEVSPMDAVDSSGFLYGGFGAQLLKGRRGLKRKHQLLLVPHISQGRAIQT